MQQEQHNPYEFIMNSGQPGPKRLGFSGASSSMSTRIAVVALGLLGLVLIVVIGLAMLSGGGGREQLLSVTQVQAETNRVATSIVKESGDQSVKNAAMNVQLATSSDQAALASLLDGRGVRFGEKEVALGTNAETDASLSTAKSAGTYDATALDILNKQVDAYQAALSSAYESTATEEIRTLLSSQYEGTELLKKSLTTARP